ncbi:MAG: sigma 54-interacting transcriptional regulator [Thermodesulfobacteriota bacterium]|nr:sigma 54-interacting transcriptional regulator [Thermodesulfobacteriota bacterium]
MIMNSGSILFICAENAARSQMAEAFAKAMAPADVVIFSAGTEPAKEVHPVAAAVMKEEFGIDLDGSPKTIEDLKVVRFDLAITLCETARQGCPAIAGSPAVVHWNVEDPGTVTGDEKTIRDAFYKTARTIRQLVNDLFERGYFSAFLNQKRNNERIIDNLSEGVMAHDLNRRIFFFSRGAEKMTGLAATEVIGKDCYEVFLPRLCGENCSFCDGLEPPSFRKKCYSTVIPEIQGERKELDVTVVPIRDVLGEIQGVVASLHDQTQVKQNRREEEDGFAGIIGRTEAMQQVFGHIRDLSVYDVPVHIHGETGTGKELVAKAIHNESTRRNGPFVPINCGALPEGLVESELFGHVKGSFTGAVRDKKGRFELADNGTIFLDEIAELPQSTQVKLLRFLQEGVLEKVGSEKEISVDVRVISATNKSLKEEIQKETFREDLYYRLNVVPIFLPPLRDRKNDIPLLVSHFLKKSARRFTGKKVAFSEAALRLMMDYPWPGNVRELENVIQFVVIKSAGGTIQPSHLPPEIRPAASQPRESRGRKNKLNAEAVKAALVKAGGNKAKAARILGVGRATLYRFIGNNPSLGEKEQ